jgi:hypothetical protein
MMPLAKSSYSTATSAASCLSLFEMTIRLTPSRSAIDFYLRWRRVCGLFIHLRLDSVAELGIFAMVFLISAAIAPSPMISTLFGAPPNAISAVQEPPPEYLDDGEDDDKDQQGGFRRDAERGDQVEEQYRERCVHAEAERRAF